MNSDRLRKVGNAGIVVQTTSVAAAGSLREAVPATMRVTESRKRQPMVCLSAVEGDPIYESVVEALYEQNFMQNALLVYLVDIYISGRGHLACRRENAIVGRETWAECEV